jgi:myo-inositol-1(or 4)-monophosphatase
MFYKGNVAMTSHVIPGLETRLALAEAVAREAGDVALDYFKRRETLVIETKRDPQDVVSIADREVENLIRARFHEAYPTDGILGEEYGLTSGTSGFTWVIDPIDEPIRQRHAELVRLDRPSLRQRTRRRRYLGALP